jgi:hypothetical protein
VLAKQEVKKGDITMILLKLVLALSLTSTLNVITPFKEGLEALKNEKPDVATKKLTQVYENEATPPRIRQLATYFAAKALQKKGDKGEAKAVVKELVQQSVPPDIHTAARKLFVSTGGNPSELMPALSPGKTFSLFLQAAAEGDIEKANSYCSGEFKKFLTNELNNRPEHLKSLAEETEGYDIRNEKITKKEGKPVKATLLVQFESENVTFTLKPSEGKWHLDSFIENHHKSRPHPAEEIFRKKIQNDLRLIYNAIQMCTLENNLGPRGMQNLTLTDIAPFMEEVPTVKHARSGKVLSYFMPKGEGDLIAISPLSVAGKRHVLKKRGSVQEIQEKAFQKLAVKHEWNKLLQPIVEKEDLSQKELHTGKALINLLRKGNFKERTEAREGLIKMGAAAEPLLRDLLESDDPELRMTAKEILTKIP